ncbi:MAG: hypothetical protein HFF01_01075 [Erysipelotrichaceae bacterium]|nr:hypothetical protein [Erysipelotrichaceae bacterium]MCI9523627.1 hypothetical protein [Erysipelotrichaceae bacterium]
MKSEYSVLKSEILKYHYYKALMDISFRQKQDWEKRLASAQGKEYQKKCRKKIVMFDLQYQRCMLNYIYLDRILRSLSAYERAIILNPEVKSFMINRNQRHIQLEFNKITRKIYERMKTYYEN